MKWWVIQSLFMHRWNLNDGKWIEFSSFYYSTTCNHHTHKFFLKQFTIMLTSHPIIVDRNIWTCVFSLGVHFSQINQRQPQRMEDILSNQNLMHVSHFFLFSWDKITQSSNGIFSNKKTRAGFNREYLEMKFSLLNPDA